MQRPMPTSEYWLCLKTAVGQPRVILAWEQFNPECPLHFRRSAQPSCPTKREAISAVDTAFLKVPSRVPSRKVSVLMSF